MQFRHPTRPRTNGFSLLELLIVASLCAIVFTSGALAYRAVSQSQRRSTTFQQVTLSASVATNFFPGSTTTTIDTYTAPSYGRATLASQMRNLFHEDVESGSAVFCLPRTGNINSIRERVITIGTLIPAAYDTPEKFLQLLTSLTATSTRANVFRTYRGAPPDSVTSGSTTTSLVNGSIFVLQPSVSTTEIWIRAVYEIDYIPYLDASNKTSTYPAGVPCIHASVRRYVDSTLTNFYDIVFRESTAADVGIPFVHYERAVRTNVVESAVTKWKVAGNQPFYQVWWPDPGVPRLKSTAVLTGATPTYAAGTMRAEYAKHEGQTSFSFIVPQFPCF